MLRIFLILLIIVQPFFFKKYYVNPNVAAASQIKALPKKRPEQSVNYEESLKNIHDLIQKEGGKKIGLVKVNIIKNGENLHKFLLRVGFTRDQAEKIIKSIKSQRTAQIILRKIPINHEVKFSLPNRTLGASLEFKINRDKNVYVWQNVDGKFISKITKRPSFNQVEFNQGIIKTNLYNASIVSKITKQAFHEMVSILGFVIDFQRDIRRGDKFEILYQKKIDLIDKNLISSEPIEYVGITLSGKKSSYYRYKTKNGDISYFDEKGISSKRTLMKTPLNGARVSSGYGSRKHPILGYTKMHKGIDFAAPIGTPVFAAGDGLIEFSGTNGSYGKYIRIRHNSSYKTAYAHLSKIIKRKFTRVKQGEVIGLVGNTGRSTGPHLHYEIILSGKKVNPLKVKIPSGKNLKKSEIKKFRNHILDLKNKISLASKLKKHGTNF